MYSSDDELPQPPGSRSPSPPLPLNTAAFRKRSYGEASEASSDMPFFSSDDLADASIGNYTSPRHKKQYRRTWWESESSSAATRKENIRRAAKRAKDSGVFMPSSDSSGPEEGFGYNQLKPVTPPKRESSTISPKRVAQSGAPISSVSWSRNVWTTTLRLLMRSKRVVYNCLKIQILTGPGIWA